MTNAYSRSPDSTYPAKLVVLLSVPVFALTKPTASGAVSVNRFRRVPEIPLIGKPLISGSNRSSVLIFTSNWPTRLAVTRFSLDKPLASLTIILEESMPSSANALEKVSATPA